MLKVPADKNLIKNIIKYDLFNSELASIVLTF